MRLGTRNRLLTKRDSQSFEWLYLDTYIDAFIEDPEGQRNFSNLYNDVRWQPLPWLGVDLETQFPIVNGGSGFNEFNTQPAFHAHRQLRVFPRLPLAERPSGADRFQPLRFPVLHPAERKLGRRHAPHRSSSTTARSNTSNTRSTAISETGWPAWASAIADNRLQDEYGVVFSLTLKDFPSVSLPFEIDAQ